jgi:hypothetical protein
MLAKWKQKILNLTQKLNIFQERIHRYFINSSINANNIHSDIQSQH